MGRLLTCALSVGLGLTIVAAPARAALYSDFLDGVLAALEIRSASHALDKRQQKAVDRALALADRPHEALSRDLKTAGRMAKLVTKKLADDAEIVGLMLAALDAMEATVIANAGDAGIVLAESGLPMTKQAKWFAKIAKPQLKAIEEPDPARRIKLYARSQKVIEKVLAKYPT